MVEEKGGLDLFDLLAWMDEIDDKGLNLQKSEPKVSKLVWRISSAEAFAGITDVYSLSLAS